VAHRDDEGTQLGIDVLGGHVSLTWRRVRKAASLDGYTLHDLRHSYASGLVASGCDVVTVQRTLRHPSATTTLGVCSHLWPTAEDRTRAAAGDLMAAALGARADSLRTADAVTTS
jgi:integrase